MSLFFHSLVSVLAVGTMLASTRVFLVNKHPLFYVLFSQLLAYCFLAPSYSVFANELQGTDIGDWYLYLQSLCLFIFIPIFIFSYSGVTKSHQAQTNRNTLIASHVKLTYFATFSFVSSLIYLLTLAYFGLLFRRIGHGALASEYLNLPTVIFLAIRTYDRLLLSLVIINYIAFHYSRVGKQKRIALVGLLATFGAQIVVAALNSRFQLAITFTLLWLVSLSCNYQEGKQYRIQIPWRKVAMVGLLLLSLNFTLNFREKWQGSFLETFNFALLYTHVSSSATSDTIGSMSNRLDGIDLMARMGPGLSHEGYSYGKSWYPSLLATVGYLWDPDGAREVKAEMATSPKYHLMYQYAGIDMVDYPSCVLTDAYGNFGALGIFFAALTLGVGCAITQRILISPPSRLAIVVGIIAIQVITYFEGAFLHHLFLGWLQYLPCLLILYVICPLKTVKIQRSKSTKHRHPERPTYGTLQSQHLYSRI